MLMCGPALGEGSSAYSKVTRPDQASECPGVLTEHRCTEFGGFRRAGGEEIFVLPTHAQVLSYSKNAPVGKIIQAVGEKKLILQGSVAAHAVQQIDVLHLSRV
jgi:hypothetical protein